MRGGAMTDKHTPGPLEVVQNNTRFGIFAAGPLGDRCLATVFTEADANLYAVAPELLEALERLIPTSAYGPARDQAEAAVAKAKGET